MGDEAVIFAAGFSGARPITDVGSATAGAVIDVLGDCWSLASGFGEEGENTNPVWIDVIRWLGN